MNPEVSVIIPVYNVEQYLSQCIESVLNQSFSNFELLLIDDGSSDKSGSICDSYAHKDKRIKVKHTINKGVSSARNTGIENAKGNWIIFIDSDDWVGVEYINDLLKAVDNNNMLVVQGVNYLYNDKNKNHLLSFDNQTVNSTSYDILFSNIELYKYGYPFSKLYNRNIIINNNIRFDEDISMSEDLIFMLQYILKVRSIKFISKSNYYYRLDTCGLTSKLPSFISSNKLYQSLFLLIDEMDNMNINNLGLNELRKLATKSLMLSIFTNYTHGHIKRRRERLVILNNLQNKDLKLIKDYYKIPRKYYNIPVYLIRKQRYKYFDFFLILLFKIRNLIKSI